MASRSRSRSPIRRNSEDKCNDSELQEKKSIDGSCEKDDDSVPDEDKFWVNCKDVKTPFAKKNPYKLYIFNIPTTWKYADVKNFIHHSVTFKKEVSLGYIGVVKRKSCNNKLKIFCTVAFPDKESRLEAFHQLCGLEVEGKKLRIELIPEKFTPNSNSKINIDDDTNNIKFIETMKPFERSNLKQDKLKFKVIQRSLESPNETYGLSLQFLSSLGITTPLVPRIIVSNLAPNVVITKIKEVFSMAGQVLDVSIMNNNTKEAAVSYDHPIEAVQAISMFNNVELYSYKMSVAMDRMILGHKIVLPRGLGSLGPGLGAGGGVLRYARPHADLLALARRLDSLCDTVQAAHAPPAQPWQSTATWTGSQGGVADASSQIVNLLQTLVKQTTNAAPPMQNPLGTGQHTAPIPSPSAQLGMGPNTTIQYPMQNKVFGAPPQSIPQSPFLDAGPSNKFDHNIPKLDAMRYENKDPRRADNKPSELIVIRYLPPYVTLDVLKQKMSEVGKLAFAEMTGHGKALLRFTNKRDGDECIKLFDRSKVDGQIIEVQYF